MINGVKRIGIIGGGQLAKMMILPAHEMGLSVFTLDPAEHCPVSGVADEHIVGEYDDFNKLLELAYIVGKDGVITYDLEHIGMTAARRLEELGYQIHPSLDILENIQDKFRQKQVLKSHGLPVAEFAEMRDVSDVRNWFAEKGKSVLKNKRFSYDGYGNFVISNESDIEIGFEKLSQKSGGIYIERFVPYTKEVSVNIARSLNGERAFYPIADNEHKDNILHTTVAPALVSNKTGVRIMEIAKGAASAFNGAGNFGVEMFIIKNTARVEAVLINELVPRPHNSGHFTIEFCKTSQFENHIRGICGAPLGSTAPTEKHALMFNILGEKGHSGAVKYERVENAMKLGFKPHLYGKEETRPSRKMGHMTYTGSRVEILRFLENRERVRIKAIT
jgi:5-(carboxyamino)imidazole ribonucleotide synthase